MPKPTCVAVDCERPTWNMDLCSMHWQRWRHIGVLYLPPRPTGCKIEGCERPLHSHKMCRLHLRRERRGFSPEGPPPPKNRYINSSGYVQMFAPDHPLAQAKAGSTVAEHRVVLYDKIGPGDHQCHWCDRIVSWDKRFPEETLGLCVDHLNFNTADNRPENLVPTCHRCNIRRSFARRGHHGSNEALSGAMGQE